MFNLYAGQGLGLRTEKEIAFGLGTPYGEVLIETVEPDLGGGVTKREYTRTSKRHEGKWKKRLDAEERELLEIIAIMNEML